MSKKTVIYVKWFFAAVLFCTAAVINAPRRSEPIRVSVDVVAQTNIQMQVFYATASNAPYKGFVGANVPRGKHSVGFEIPEDRVQRIRLDFGNQAGSVELRNLVVRGDCEFRPSWRDFTPNRYIASFKVKGGEAFVSYEKGDPYVVCTKSCDVGIPKELPLNWFVLGCRIFVLALALLVYSLLRRMESITFESRDLTLFFLVVCVTLIRLSLSASLTPRFMASSWDDTWFVNAGETLLAGKWLGEYDLHTLIKGCVGPMVIAFSRWLGVPFLSFSNFLHIVACIVFSFLLLRLSMHRGLAFLAYCYLLFNPLSFGMFTWQRVYRNGMILWQLPLLLWALYKCYQLGAERISRLWPWLVGAGVGLWMFFNTREDGIWFVPFVVGCLGSAASRGMRSLSWLNRAKRGVLFAVPFFVLILGNLLLNLINERVYGVPLRNDRDAGNYALAMRDLYLIKPDPKEEARLSKPTCRRHYHNVYYSTVRRAYKVSPTLSLARKEINNAIESWAKSDGLPDGEPWGDHILFALRNGAFNAGYYQCLRTSEDFWGRVHKELQQAFADGRLQKRGLALTAMAAPFQSKFVLPFFDDYWDALCKSVSCANVPVARRQKPISEKYRALFRQGALAEDDYATRENELKDYVVRLDVVANWYACGCTWLFWSAVVLYAVWTVWLLRIRKMEGLWLLATGVVMSGLLQCACIAYITVSTFYASGSFYLCPSYLCFMMFSVIVLNGVAKTFREHRKSGEICKTDT